MNGRFGHRYAALLLFVLAGLTVLGPPLPGQTVLAQPVELNLATHWEESAAWTEILMKYIDEYNALQSDVVVTHTYNSGFQNAISEEFLVQMAAGVGPDIIHTSTGGISRYASMNLISPPPPALMQEFQAFFLPAAAALATVRGVLYGPPTENQPYGMIINGRLFDEFGVAREIPTSWDQLAEQARVFRQFDPDGALRRTGVEIITGRARNTLAFANGASFLDPSGERLTLNTREWRETLAFLRGLVEVQSAVSDATSRPGHLYFQNEGTAIRLGANPYMRRQLLPQFDNDYARYLELMTGPMPAGPSGTQPPLAGQYGYILAVTTQAEHPEKAWEFVRWLTAEVTEEGHTRMGAVMHYYGSIPNTMADFTSHPYRDEPFIQGFMGIIQTGRTTTFDLPEPLVGDFASAMAARMNAAIIGEEPVENVLEELQALGQRLLSEPATSSP